MQCGLNSAGVEGRARVDHPKYYTGSTYTIPGPWQQHNFSKEELFENYFGNHTKIVFEIELTPPISGLVYIDQQSGDIIISPTEKRHLQTRNASNYTAALYGRDVKGAKAVVAHWSFSVEIREKFEVEEYTRANSSHTGSNVVHNVVDRAEQPFAVNEAFQFARVTLTKVRNANPKSCRCKRRRIHCQACP